MSVQSPPVRYDPASWAANRSDAGWALLGTVWSSAFWGGAVAAWSDDNEDLAGVLSVMAGFSSLLALIALTLIGCRLAFGRAEPRPRRPRKTRSEAQLMAFLGLGTVLAITIVVVAIVAIR